MGNIGDAISTLVPAVGAAETAASESVSELLTELKNRLTGKVTTSELSIDAALSVANFGVEDAAYVELVTQFAKPTARETLYSKSEGGIDELFYQDSAGTEVQITAAGAVNVSATGAITGAGYGASGVEVNWNAAGNNYLFKDGSGSDDYADVVVDKVLLRDGSGNAITFGAPALGADYPLTLPAAAASTDAYLKVDSGGAITFEESRTVAVMQDINTWVVAGGTPAMNGTGTAIDLDSTSDAIWFPITGLEEGDVLTSVVIRADDDTTGTVPQITFHKATDGTGALLTLDSGAFDQAGVPTTYTFAVSGATTLAAGQQFYIGIDVASSSSNDLLIYQITANVTRAA